MKKYIAPIAGLFALPAFAEEPLNILVDTPNTYAVVQSIAPENAEITILLEPSQSAHHLSFTPEQVARLDSADYIFGMGSIFMPEIVEAAENVSTNPDNIAFYYDNGLDANAEIDDPHFWLSQKHLKDMQAFFASQLPDAKEPVALDIPAPNLPEGQLPIVAGHDAFRYYEQDNNIETYGALKGPNDEDLPPREYAELVAHIEAGDVNCILMLEADHDHDHEEMAHDFELKEVSVDLLGWKHLEAENYFQSYFSELNAAYESCI